MSQTLQLTYPYSILEEEELMPVHRLISQPGTLTRPTDTQLNQFQPIPPRSFNFERDLLRPLRRHLSSIPSSSLCVILTFIFLTIGSILCLSTRKNSECDKHASKEEDSVFINLDTSSEEDRMQSV